METRSSSRPRMLPDHQSSIHKVNHEYLTQVPVSVLTSSIAGDLFSKNKEDVKAREAELSAQGQYFSASYAAERGLSCIYINPC